MKICLIRLDKIGDLVSTLPVDQIPELKSHEVKWVIAEGLGFLAKRSEPAREFLEIPLHNPKAAQKKLLAFLKAEKFDLAVFFYGPWWASKTLWQAGVARRFGRRSQWHSYVFLNEGIRQSRSLGEKHEADYNLELLLAALHVSSDNRTAPVLNLNAPSFRHLYEKFELKPGQYFVVHPGMAGSALNWPSNHYVSLVEKLKLSKEVVITGTPQDEKWLAPLKLKFANDPRVQVLQGQLSIEELMFVLKSSAGVVAPSTGVIHLAASLGVPAVGLYSPIASQHPRRWGPRGSNVQVLVGELNSEHPEDLGSIQPEDVLKNLPI